MTIGKAKTILIKPSEKVKDQMQLISDHTGIKNIPDLIRFSLSVTVKNIININKSLESRQKGVNQ